MIVYPLTRRESWTVQFIRSMAWALGLPVLALLISVAWGCHGPTSSPGGVVARAAPESDPDCTAIYSIPRGACLDCGFKVVPLADACLLVADGPDLDGDGDVDLADFALFQAAMGDGPQ